MCDRKSNDVTSGKQADVQSGYDRSIVLPPDIDIARPAADATRELGHWLIGQLSRLYGDIIDEPLPPRMLDLLAQLRRGKKDIVRHSN